MVGRGLGWQKSDFKKNLNKKKIIWIKSEKEESCIFAQNSKNILCITLLSVATYRLLPLHGREGLLCVLHITTDLHLHNDTAHCKLHSSHYTLYSIHSLCTLFTYYFKLHTAHYTLKLPTENCPLHTLTVQFNTVHSTHNSLHTQIYWVRLS